MFKFAKKRQVLWPITIEMPNDDGTGQTTKVNAKIRYALMNRDEMNAALRESRSVDVEKALDAAYVSAVDARLRDRVVGWEDITDIDTGAPLEFNSDNRDALLQIPYVRSAIDNGLWEASRGAAVKNLLPGSDGTQTPTDSGQDTAKTAE